jgi:hypothetical protein
MNQILLQIWEESELGNQLRPDGCSLHLDYASHKEYINFIVNSRNSEIVPAIYENFVGDPVYVFVNDVIYGILQRDKNVRLQEHEFNNLLGLREIEISND